MPPHGNLKTHSVLKCSINGPLFFTQVTIEVVDGLEGHEPEKGLRKESKPNWTSNWRNWWTRSSSFTTHQIGENDRSYGSNSEDSNFLRPSTEWDRRGGTRGGSKAQAEYGENDRRVEFVRKQVHNAQSTIFSRVHRLLLEHWSSAFPQIATVWCGICNLQICWFKLSPS